MKLKNCFLYVLAFIPAFLFAQTSPVQDASTPKDAPINVTIKDFKQRALNNEIVVFRSEKNGKEFQGLSNDDGKFSIRLPAGDKYEIFVLGFKDSSSLIVLEVPAISGKAYYKDAMTVDLEHQPAKTFVLEDCNFETGKATLEESSYTVLDELVAYLLR